MASQVSAVRRGFRLARDERRRVGTELRIAREVAGLSQRSLARMLDTSHASIGRIERGETTHLDLVRVVVTASVLGLGARVGLHPIGSPLRDAGHLHLISRLRARVSKGLRWRTEVPIPILGDLRSADVVIDGDDVSVMVEVETRLADVQALERRISTKQRDLGVRRVILLVADTRHNRRVLADHPELRIRFPSSARACLAALRAGREPAADSLVLL